MGKYKVWQPGWEDDVREVEIPHKAGCLGCDLPLSAPSIDNLDPLVVFIQGPDDATPHVFKLEITPLFKTEKGTMFARKCWKATAADIEAARARSSAAMSGKRQHFIGPMLVTKT